MTAYLLDVSLLYALIWPSHEFNQQAQNWFAKRGKLKWATCPLTQAAFVRLSSNRSLPKSMNPKQAVSILRISLAHPGHHFWPDSISFLDAVRQFDGEIKGHQQVTDAYLLGLAISNRGKLATLDTRIASLLPAELNPAEFIELIS